jgi:hypothetical protein
MNRNDMCKEILSLENELEVLIEIGIRADVLKQKRRRLSKLKSVLKNKSKIEDPQIDKLFLFIK